MERVIRTRRLFILLTFLGGLSWGLMSTYILHVDTLAYALFVIILAEGMTAAGTAIYAAYPAIYASFAFPALLPQAIYLLVHQGQTQNIYGALILIFLTLMTVTALRLTRLVDNSISIQFDNIRLLDDIEEERKQISELNKQLELDLEELRERDMQLIEEKNKAEDLAKKLLILSTRDGLTGIANRRHFDEFLAKEWNRAVRSGNYLSLILCDIDYFKSFNDRYGHQQGDRCLQYISNVLEEHTRREGDIAARYGGEEFVIVLSDTTLENAKIYAEKVKTAIETLAIPHESSAVANIVTISMGISSIVPTQDIYSSSLISEADMLLYHAKAKGRNRIEAAEFGQVKELIENFQSARNDPKVVSIKNRRS